MIFVAAVCVGLAGVATAFGVASRYEPADTVTSVLRRTDTVVRHTSRTATVVSTVYADPVTVTSPAVVRTVTIQEGGGTVTVTQPAVTQTETVTVTATVTETVAGTESVGAPNGKRLARGHSHHE